MRRRGEPSSFENITASIAMKSVARLREVIQEDLASVLDNLEPFRGTREDEEPFVRRRPGRPRKVVNPLDPVPPKRKGRRPKGRKKMIREAMAFRALQARLNRPMPPRLPRGTPPPIPEDDEPTEKRYTPVPPPTSPEPTFDDPAPLTYAPLIPPQVSRELEPPPRVEWETFAEKFGVFEVRQNREEARTTLTLYREDRPTCRADCMTAAELANDEEWVRANPGKRPVDGKNSARPCPWVSCRNHMAVNVTSCGSLQVMEDWDDGRPTCVLDIVDANGPSILDKAGKFFGLTRERLRQIELKALHRARVAKVEFEDPVERRTNEAA